MPIEDLYNVLEVSTLRSLKNKTTLSLATSMCPMHRKFSPIPAGANLPSGVLPVSFDTVPSLSCTIAFNAYLQVPSG